MALAFEMKESDLPHFSIFLDFLLEERESEINENALVSKFKILFNFRPTENFERTGDVLVT